MASFEKALRKVLQHEGVLFDGPNPKPGRTGYVNHPDDPGGETHYGITAAVAIAHGYAGSMRDIPYAMVCTIYKQSYWDKVRGDAITDQAIAEELFDTAVNCGVATVVKFLQRVLNALNKKAVLYADVKVDGDFGDKTFLALQSALCVDAFYSLCILRALDSLQCVRYIELAEHNEKFETFMAGWLRTRVGGYE